jgi:hypothetical protein
MNQKERIISYLLQHKRRGITPVEAAHFLGILKLSTRIGEIREECCFDIKQEFVEVANRYGDVTRVCRYWLK